MPLDQLVHLAEAPVRRRLAPEPREVLRRRLGGELGPRLRELLLVPRDLVLDRAQPSHPRRRPAERHDPRVGVGTEVPHALPQRLPGDGAVGEILLEHATLAAVARRFGPDRALRNDLLEIPRIHPSVVCPLQ